MNRLFRADAAHTLSAVPEGSADLVYLDPPFAVDKAFTARPAAAAGQQAKRERARGPVAYGDRWPSLEAYLAWLVPRVELGYRALSARGTLWLHLDHHATHAAHAAVVGALGARAFAGEIIWVPGNGAKARGGLPRAHQTLHVWKKSDAYTWNAKASELREPYAATSLSMHFTRKDEAGRAYRDRTVGGKTYRYYADEGRAVGSVWTDCPAMLANTPLRAEGTGYPTQKPEKLLARIVCGASAQGGLVVDPFVGSGTTLAVASTRGRRFVGGDVGELAIRTTRARLADIGADYTYEDGAVAQNEEPG
ncbi:MAG: site-specific DNA-methyltransferase [Myxococcales bacterium]|nr:site-specific DNA-methyltransferase [Myxococcales bacterium]